MEKLTKGVVNCTTGESQVIELSDIEISELEVLAAQAEAERAEKSASEERILALKNSAKSKLIAGQPLTEEEASVLII